jgi:hypothetical protein
MELTKKQTERQDFADNSIKETLKLDEKPRRKTKSRIRQNCLPFLHEKENI